MFRQRLLTAMVLIPLVLAAIYYANYWAFVAVVDETFFSKQLATDELPDPDLFIRTSGEHRISNFFLWQLAYTELYFSDVHWPDFGPDEFEKALASFRQRERRYGKTSSQLIENNNV